MSKRHPVVAVTGSSGAGTSTVKRAFEHIFAREGITPAVVEGDSYHRYERMPMKEAMAEALADAKAALVADQKFLAELDGDCDTKKNEMEERVKMRADELVAAPGFAQGGAI